jgi:hypothetical protein
MSKNYTTHFKMCDAILKNISSKQLHDVLITDHLSEPENEIKGALELLDQDGYIKWTDRTTFYIRATVNGFRFYGRGGYLGQIRRFFWDRVHQTLTLWLLVLGTCAAGIWGVVETVKFFLNCSCY